MTLCDEIYRIAKQEAGMMSDVLSERGYNNEKSFSPMVASNLEEIKGYISKYNPSEINPCKDIQDLTESMQLAIGNFNQYIAEIAGVSLKEFLPLKSVEPEDVLEDSHAIWSVHNSFISHVNALDPQINTMGYGLGSEVLETVLLRDMHHINRPESNPHPNTD